MLPTLNVKGDVVLTEYISPRLSLLKPGDVVVATKPNDRKTSVIKRIRGVSGDTIWVHRHGALSPEQIVVPTGHVWLEGDNPLQSTDSRNYGPVPLGLVRGRIVLRFWPLTQARMIERRVIDHTAAFRQAALAASSAAAAAPADTEPGSAAPAPAAFAFEKPNVP
jgi:signal peptidase I